jgi:hypothetical protein
MEMLGQRDCQPVGDCGSGTYGAIPLSPNTIRVDQAYAGGSSDGTAVRPFTRIGEALSAAPEGAHVAVAAGAYPETLVITKKVVLEGRCAQLVTIRPAGGTATVDLRADGITLRGVTIGGVRSAVRIVSRQATLEQVIVEGCGGEGLVVLNGAKLVVRSSVISGNKVLGIGVATADLTLERSVVKGTRPADDSLEFGNGIQATRVSAASGPSSITLRDSLFDGNRGAGIVLRGSVATLERCVVRNTASQAKDGKLGTGIEAIFKVEPSKLTLRDTLVASNRYCGINIEDSSAVLERTVVRDTQAQEQPGTSVADVEGGGIMIIGSATTAELQTKDSLVTGNHEFGVMIRGAEVTLETTVIRNTSPRVTDNDRGHGLEVIGEKDLPTTATLRASSVAGNRCVGIIASGASITLEGSVVRDTASCADHGGGAGIVLQGSAGTSTVATLRESAVAGNRWAGVAVFGAELVVERSVVRGTMPQDLDQTLGLGVAAVGGRMPAGVTMSQSLVEGNHVTGVLLDRALGTVTSSVVRHTEVETKTSDFGDGVEVWSCEPALGDCTGDLPSGLTFASSVVEGSARAGLLFVSAGGVVQASVLRRGVFAVDLEEGADPAIAADVLFQENVENRVTFGSGLKCSSLPAPPFL